MKKKPVLLQVSDDIWLEACNIGKGVFYPLKGFMDSADYSSVVENMHLKSGSPWTIPITLDISENLVGQAMKSESIVLVNNKREKIAEVDVEDIYKVHYDKEIKMIFGSDDIAHPGVEKERNRSSYRVGGPIRVTKYEENLFPEYDLTPRETKKIFKERNWKTVTGFQTRNPIHRAHEYLQRVAMEVTDGILIHPLIGWKKEDDFSPLAVVSAYEKMISEFYPKNRVVLGALRTPMRYAGPREAVFHAIIRKNYGCTHFIVGRDHAGVGGFYGKYEAQELCKTFGNLGIEILDFCGPYYCRKCMGIVTEKICAHTDDHVLHISGTEMRNMLKNETRPPAEFMREEISDTLIELANENKLFVGNDCNEI